MDSRFQQVFERKFSHSITIDKKGQKKIMLCPRLVFVWRGGNNQEEIAQATPTSNGKAMWRKGK